MKQVFPARIHKEFADYTCPIDDGVAPEIKTKIFLMKTGRAASLRDLFGQDNVAQRCLSRHQIITWIQYNKEHVPSHNSSPDAATLFLFERNSEVFVAEVSYIKPIRYYERSGLGVDSYRVSDDHILREDVNHNKYRIVIPCP